MLPPVQRSMSDSLPSDIDYHYVPPKSRMELVQSAIRAFLINVSLQNNKNNKNKNHQVRLFLFNHQTEIVQGTLNQLQERMDRIHPDHGTDMILCFQQMKASYDLLTPEEQERVVCGILTDGMHNTNADATVHMDDVLKDTFYNKLFRSIIGIGNRDTVDFDVLTKLAGGRPDVFQLVSEESEVFHVMNGTFFDMLTARVTDASFSILCRNNETLVHMANVKKTYYTEEEYQAQKQKLLVLTECNFMKLNHYNDTFVLDYVEPEPERKHVAPQEVVSDEKEELNSVNDNVRYFWLGIDVSGSMDTTVMGIDPLQQVVSETVIRQVSETHPYVEVTMPVSSVSEHTHLIGCGTVLDSWVSYIHPKTKVLMNESISTHETLDSNPIMEFVKTVVTLSDKLSKVMKKKKVQELYRTHLYLPQLLDSGEVPSWLQAQGKIVWKNLKQRFMSTLSRGEQFFHQTPIAYDMMLRAVSSNASTQSATPFAGGSPVSMEDTTVPTDEINKCKLCFEKTIDVLFPTCRHAGLCKECYTSHLDSTGKHICPFCRKEVNGWSTIDVNNTKNGYCQEEGCYQYCDYVGHATNAEGMEICGHLLYCKACKKKNKTKEGVMCHQCKNMAQTVRIYLC
jgi:hypothetical protein